MFRLSFRAGVALVIAGSLAGCAAAPSEDPPRGPVPLEPPPPVLASIVYRGVPAGEPRLDDLAAIRAYDFAALSWPAGSATPVEDVREMAATVGLTVIEAAPGAFLTPEAALDPGAVVTIDVGSSATSVFALAWRAVAHGARTVVFDAGEAEGAGFTDGDEVVRPWVTKARAVARQLTFNSALIDALQPGPSATILEPPSAADAGLDVVILQTDRSWVLMPTNTSDLPIHAVAKIPTAVPPALWVDLLDGVEMSMLNEPDGPQWTFALEPDGVRFYAIDKGS